MENNGEINSDEKSTVSHNPADYIDDEIKAEVEATEKVINALAYYKRHAMHRLKLQAEAVFLMSTHFGPGMHRAVMLNCNSNRQLVIPEIPNQARMIKEYAQVNQKFIDNIIHCGVGMLGDDSVIKAAYEITQLRPPSEHFMTKTKSIIKQIVRDWSKDGANERVASYSRVLKAMNDRFPDKESRSDLQVLVPGAGLGRLAWELIQDGFSVMGNEFSLFMLLTSNFILNVCQKIDEFKIYPYLLDFSNIWNYDDQLKAVTFPDVNPSAISSQDRKNTFAMCAGDFLTAFNDENEKFDAVVSVFFLDTAVNPISYIRTIHRILKPGGVWVNFGPLTYHYEGSEEDLSLELPYDQIIKVVEKIGFRIEKNEGRGINPEATYTCNQDSMLTYIYNCGFFECIKL